MVQYLYTVDYTIQETAFQLEISGQVVYNAAIMSSAWNREMSQEPTLNIRDVPVYGDVVLAPLAGYSDLPFRSICRAMGSAMSYTEFVSAHGVLRQNERTLEILSFLPEERPVTFQVFGHEPQSLVEACLRLQDLGPDIIDINLGCPSPRIASKGGGSGLLREPHKIAQIVATLVKYLSLPITAKIRLGWDTHTRNHVEVARILEDGGVAMIAVHGRTRDETYSTPADWDAIAEVKQSVQVPVLGNGDVKSPADIDRLKHHTRCDGVMIGRGAIGNPWILAHRELAQVPLQERWDVIRQHLNHSVAFYGEKRGILCFRKHVVQYIRGLPGASKLRVKLMQHTTQVQVLEELEGFLRTHLRTQATVL